MKLRTLQTPRISQALLLGAIVAVTMLGACTSASGPTYNLYSEKLSDGTRQYRVECDGLFESAATCHKIAQRTCGDQAVSVVEERDRWRGTGADADKSDPRLLVFRCEAPVAKAEPVQHDEQALQNVENFTIDADTLFAFGKSDLHAMLPAGRQRLDEIVARIREHDHVGDIRVTGHTDRIGSPQFNDRLSLARAKTVRRYMIAHGLDGRIIHAAGVGSRESVTNCPAGESRAVIACLQPDRRVTITATSN
jgi:outer membrane protein OmpA-like peptidoglycan-associated protein